MLSRAYLDLPANPYSLKDPLSYCDRWTFKTDKEEEYNADGYLTDFQSIRMSYAGFYVKYDAEKTSELISSEDIALRAAAYSAGQLKDDQISEAINRDSLLAVRMLIGNDSVWRQKTQRRMLEDKSFEALKESDGESFIDIYFYKTKERHQQENPQWNWDEYELDDELEAEPLATVSQLNQVNIQLSNQLRYNEKAMYFLFLALALLIFFV